MDKEMKIDEIIVKVNKPISL